jgi:hypothetical protein
VLEEEYTWGVKDGARLRPVSENYQGLYVLFSVLLACRRSLYPWSSEEEIEGGKGSVFRGKEDTPVLGCSRIQLDGLRLVYGVAGM